MAFDVLYHDGRQMTRRPLRERRARLEKVLDGGQLVLPVRRLARNGFEAWSEVIARDYAGLVAKDEGEPVRGRADAPLVEGEAEGLDRRGGPVATADQRGAPAH
jgi:ATP-dependent DNA ligase